MIINKIKKALLCIFVFIVIIATAAAVYYVSVPVNTLEHSYETVKKSISAKRAYIIRDEEIYFADTAGTLYNNVRDGERIKADSLLATIYHTDISPETLKALRTIDNKIEKQKESDTEFTDFRFDRTDTESRVAAIVEDIPNVTRRNDVLRIGEYKKMINDIRSGNEISEQNILEELYAQKADIEQKINASKSEITTSKSGVFTTYTDGLEAFLKVDDIEGYTVEYINSLPGIVNDRLTSSTVKDGEPIGKVVNNHTWYLLMSVDAAQIEGHKKGESVTVVLDAIGEDNIKGTIYSISEEDGEDRLVAIKCWAYIEGAFSYRASSAELIFESYSGYKVPVYAIRTDKNGDKYVLASKGAQNYSCYCTVDYTNTQEDYVIINSLPNAQYKLENMERIIVGEK